MPAIVMILSNSPGLFHAVSTWTNTPLTLSGPRGFQHNDKAKVSDPKVQTQIPQCNGYENDERIE